MSRPRFPAALSTRKLKGLKVGGNTGDWEWLLLDLPDRQASAIPLLTRKGGVMLAVPGQTFTDQELNDGKVEGSLTDLGPHLLLDVPVDSAEQSGDVSVLVLDFPNKTFSFLKLMGPDPTWADGVAQFELDGELVRPDMEELMLSVREWIGGCGPRESDSYLTALEGDAGPTPQPSAPVLDAVLTQLQNLATSVNALQADMGEMKAKAASQPAASSSKPQDPMAQLAKLSGKPPPTKAQTAGAPFETMAALEADMNRCSGAPFRAGPFFWDNFGGPKCWKTHH